MRLRVCLRVCVCVFVSWFVRVCPVLGSDFVKTYSRECNGSPNALADTVDLRRAITLPAERRASRVSSNLPTPMGLPPPRLSRGAGIERRLSLSGKEILKI